MTMNAPNHHLPCKPPSPWRSALSVIAAAVCATGLAGPTLSSAHATDAAVIDTSGAQPQSGRFLRLGLSKSAVIKLPAEAKDVIVGDNGIVDVVLRRKDTAYLFARETGQTNIFFFGADGQEILHLDLEVAADTKALKELLDRALPGNNIIVDSARANIVLRGTVANADEAKKAEDLAFRYMRTRSSGFLGSAAPGSPIVNLLTIAEGHQVALKVRVVELKRTVLKQLGINLQGALGDLTFQNTPVGVFDQLGSRIMDSTLKIGSGLPLSDALKVIASETAPPIGPEFNEVVDGQRVGITIDQGLERMFERMPLQEVNFLAIVLSIQSKTGGNLTESLSNLSKVLRDRRKMKSKIRAVSQEAKSSATIIGSLPFLIAGALYLLNPDYLVPLVDTQAGNILLGICAVLMVSGILVMRKMIDFEI